MMAYYFLKSVVLSPAYYSFAYLVYTSFASVKNRRNTILVVVGIMSAM